MISEQFFSLSDEIISINMPDNLSPVICYLFLLLDLSFLHCMLLTSQAVLHQKLQGSLLQGFRHSVRH